jgi:hypothetical protein
MRVRTSPAGTTENAPGRQSWVNLDRTRRRTESISANPLACDQRITCTPNPIYLLLWTALAGVLVCFQPPLRNELRLSRRYFTSTTVLLSGCGFNGRGSSFRPFTTFCTRFVAVREQGEISVG